MWNEERGKGWSEGGKWRKEEGNRGRIREGERKGERKPRRSKNTVLMQRRLVVRNGKPLLVKSRWRENEKKTEGGIMKQR